jgi:hypothetical protein
VPRHRHDEGRLALPVQPELGLVAQASGEHGAVHREEVFFGQTERGMPVGLLLDLLRHPEPSL